MLFYKSVLFLDIKRLTNNNTSSLYKLYRVSEQGDIIVINYIANNYSIFGNFFGVPTHCEMITVTMCNTNVTSFGKTCHFRAKKYVEIFN